MKIKIISFLILSTFAFLFLLPSFNLSSFVNAQGNPPSGVELSGGGNGDTTGNSASSKNIHINYVNPISVDTIDGFIATAIDALVMLLTPLVVIMIVWTGFLFIKAQGNVEALGVAKKALLYTVIGAIIVLIAKGFSLAIKSVFSEF